MISLDRVVVPLDALLACLVACFAARYSPFIKLDTALVLTGSAFAAPVLWRGQWSWSFLIRSGVTAYFFRCIVLYSMGSVAVKTIASRDIGMGLIAVGVACVLRKAISRYRAQEEWPGSSESIAYGDECGGNLPCDETVAEKAGGTATGCEREGEEPLWSRPQWTLKALLVLTSAWAALLAVAITGGPPVACGVLVFGLFWWLIAGCVRIIKAGSPDEPEKKQPGV